MWCVFQEVMVDDMVVVPRRVVYEDPVGYYNPNIPDIEAYILDAMNDPFVPPYPQGTVYWGESEGHQSVPEMFPSTNHDEVKPIDKPGKFIFAMSTKY